MLETQDVWRRLENAKRKEEKLRKSNAYFDSFRIWHDGAFGTINSHRLGRDHAISWNEVNEGFGDVALLLDIASDRVGYNIDR